MHQRRSRNAPCAQNSLHLNPVSSTPASISTPIALVTKPHITRHYPITSHSLHHTLLIPGRRRGDSRDDAVVVGRGGGGVGVGCSVAVMLRIRRTVCRGLGCCDVKPIGMGIRWRGGFDLAEHLGLECTGGSADRCLGSSMKRWIPSRGTFCCGTRERERRSVIGMAGEAEDLSCAAGCRVKVETAAEKGLEED